MQPQDQSPGVQTLLVVGGTSGIGRGVAEHFARLGARVAVAGRSADKLAETLGSLRHLGGEAEGFTADVRQPEALSEGVEALCQAWGPLDLVVSAAAGNFPALAAKMSPNAFRSVVEIDLLGSFHVLQAVYPHLKRPGASVIHISAPQAQVPMAGQAHVCAAKAGVDMLSSSLALECGSVGLSVNSVIPGPIEGTEGMQRLAPSDAQREQVRLSVPLRRLGSARDIAQACQFLASPQAAYITGAVLPVDGGWSLGGVAQMGANLGRELGL